MGVLLTIAAAGFAMWQAPQQRWLEGGLLRGALVAAPLAVGVIALRRRAAPRFAWCLLGAAVLFSLTALAESRQPVPHGLGRIAGFLVEPALAYLILSFPSGRLPARADRVVVSAFVALVVVLFVPTTLFVERFPQPSAWSTCSTDCPANPFALVDSTPAIIPELVQPVREVLAVLLFAAVGWLVLRRARSAGPVARRALAPLAAVAIFQAVAYAVYSYARARGDVTPVVSAVGWVWAMAVPAVALSFGAGLLARPLRVASTLKHLALRPHTSLDEAQIAMATALEDPSLRLVYRPSEEGASWIDHTGALVEPPRPGNGRAVTAVDLGPGREGIAVVHDEGLGQDPTVVETAASYALVAVENASLLHQLRSSVNELAESRSRLVDSTDAARRSIERDLHDGGQQQLIALRMGIAVTAEQLEDVAPDAAERVRRLGGDVDQAIVQIRRLARGIYPAVLADLGLDAALRGAARASPVPTDVDVQELPRLRPDLERTLYFACNEALQNAVKHARGATHITIRVRAHAENVVFEVEDDGAGFRVHPSRPTSTLPSLADRVGAAGGSVAIASRPGRGSTVRGTLPT